MAITSSYQDKESRASDVFIGELGLTGEVRSVADLEGRLKEAKKLGFARAIVPKNNLAGINLPDGLEVVGVTTIKQALYLALES
ncbi:DNA repair protein RadA [Fructobacillus ficulneus]|uniref:DNA repair protein RadA n=1 Tax=Fructobacillus ficulneus TaxID=157463 RepID=A0A0K8MFU5_9LACO|nr:DNA repair protein RadA [Fructobacillus ficulneus]